MSEVNNAPIGQENGETAGIVTADILVESRDAPIVAGEKTEAGVVAASQMNGSNGVREVPSPEITVDEPTKVEKEIIRQVEYYFGDFNLNSDGFLKKQISNNGGGWVPLHVLLTFKRLAALTTDAQTVVDAIMKSDAGLLEVSEDKQKVRRDPKRPIPKRTAELRQEWISRSIIVKGFPLDAELSDIINFFGQFKEALHVRMRKHIDKDTKKYTFNGSVFVTFEKKEQAAALIEKDKVMYKECELIRNWRQENFVEQREEMEIEKKTQQEHQKTKEKGKLNPTKGTVIIFENGGENITREMIRDAIVNVGNWPIAYIDHYKDEKSGYIRFQEEGLAGKFLASLEENKLKLKGDMEVTLRALNEEEEKKYMATIIRQMKVSRRYYNKQKVSNSNHQRRNIGNDTAAKKKRNADA